MSFQPVKRKRGRPKKTVLTLREDIQTEKLTMDKNKLPTNEKIEDWDKEIDGSEINEEITEPLSNHNNEEQQQTSTNSFVRVEKENSFKQPTIIHII
ncbi:MAG: cobalamin biosynthesis protein CobQ, partial [Richelia sp. RM2_1_2]|nr:cobalamin biosynthesis protein CobQ [Richelia sp. RM2_1_2]